MFCAGLPVLDSLVPSAEPDLQAGPGRQLSSCEVDKHRPFLKEESSADSPSAFTRRTALTSCLFYLPLTAFPPPPSLSFYPPLFLCLALWHRTHCSLHQTVRLCALVSSLHDGAKPHPFSPSQTLLHVTWQQRARDVVLVDDEAANISFCLARRRRCALFFLHRCSLSPEEASC